VHSFDLVPINERVTPCNLASVPLPAKSIDVAVFCLALMGTDWPLFVEEAHRCLRLNGILEVVEVESRITDVNAMIKKIENIGFSNKLSKPGNFFMEMRFVKVPAAKGKNKHKEVGGEILARCAYRRR